MYFRYSIIYFVYTNSFQLLNLKYLKYLLSKCGWYIYILTKFSYIFKVLYVLYVLFIFNPWHFCCWKIYNCKFYFNMLMCDIICVIIVCVDFYFCLIIVIITYMSTIYVMFKTAKLLFTILYCIIILILWSWLFLSDYTAMYHLWQKCLDFNINK